jgi:CheY-like chemotaxis protein
MNRGTAALLDDDPLVRRAMEHVLESIGFKVFQTAQPDIFLKEVFERPPHVALIDLELGDLPSWVTIRSGFEVIEQLFQRFGNLLPAFVLSSEREMGYVKRALTLGACDYLMKPLTKRVLLQKLEPFVEGTLKEEEESFLLRPPQPLQVKVKFPIQIQSMSMNDMTILTHASLPIGAEWPIQSPLLSQILGADQMPQRVIVQSAWMEPAQTCFGARLLLPDLSPRDKNQLRKWMLAQKVLGL